jgi:hypothetical protein
MLSIRIFQILNIALIIINGIVLFIPKRPMTGVHSNAAGGLMMIALAMLFVFAAHIILTVVAIYYQKDLMIKIVGIVMIPLSLMIWYWLGPLIRF